MTRKSLIAASLFTASIAALTVPYTTYANEQQTGISVTETPQSDITKGYLPKVSHQFTIAQNRDILHTFYNAIKSDENPTIDFNKLSDDDSHLLVECVYQLDNNASIGSVLPTLNALLDKAAVDISTGDTGQTDAPKPSIEEPSIDDTPIENTPIEEVPIDETPTDTDVPSTDESNNHNDVYPHITQHLADVTMKTNEQIIIPLQHLFKTKNEDTLTYDITVVETTTNDIHTSVSNEHQTAYLQPTADGVYTVQIRAYNVEHQLYSKPIMFTVHAAADNKPVIDKSIRTNIVYTGVTSTIPLDDVFHEVHTKNTQYTIETPLREHMKINTIQNGKMSFYSTEAGIHPLIVRAYNNGELVSKQQLNMYVMSTKPIVSDNLPNIHIENDIDTNRAIIQQFYNTHKNEQIAIDFTTFNDVQMQYIIENIFKIHDAEPIDGVLTILETLAGAAKEITPPVTEDTPQTGEPTPVTPPVTEDKPQTGNPTPVAPPVTENTPQTSEPKPVTPPVTEDKPQTGKPTPVAPPVTEDKPQTGKPTPVAPPVTDDKPQTGETKPVTPPVTDDKPQTGETKPVTPPVTDDKPQTGETTLAVQVTPYTDDTLIINIDMNSHKTINTYPITHITIKEDGIYATTEQDTFKIYDDDRDIIQHVDTYRAVRVHDDSTHTTTMHYHTKDGLHVTSSNNHVITLTKKKALPFTDVRTNQWFYDDVQSMYDYMIMNGTTDTTFAPDAAITRGQFAAMLTRALEMNNTSHDTYRLSDVDGKWYANDVETLLDLGIITGFEDGTFKGNQPITRQQAVAMMMRTLQVLDYQPVITTHASFNDADRISDYARNGIDFLSEKGILVSGDHIDFNPQANMTRAQMAKVLHKTLQLTNKY